MLQGSILAAARQLTRRLRLRPAPCSRRNQRSVTRARTAARGMAPHPPSHKQLPRGIGTGRPPRGQPPGAPSAHRGRRAPGSGRLPGMGQTSPLTRALVRLRGERSEDDRDVRRDLRRTLKKAGDRDGQPVQAAGRPMAAEEYVRWRKRALRRGAVSSAPELGPGRYALWKSGQNFPTARWVVGSFLAEREAQVGNGGEHGLDLTVLAAQRTGPEGARDRPRVGPGVSALPARPRRPRRRTPPPGRGHAGGASRKPAPRGS